MNIQITGHHIHITPALKEHIEAKAQKLSKYVWERDLHITLTTQHHGEHMVEADFHALKHNFVAKDNGKDMYSLITKVIETLNRQVINHKEKHLHHALNSKESELQAALLD